MLWWLSSQIVRTSPCVHSYPYTLSKNTHSNNTSPILKRNSGDFNARKRSSRYSWPFLISITFICKRLILKFIFWITCSSVFHTTYILSLFLGHRLFHLQPNKLTSYFFNYSISLLNNFWLIWKKKLFLISLKDYLNIKIKVIQLS